MAAFSTLAFHYASPRASRVSACSLIIHGSCRLRFERRSLQSQALPEVAVLPKKWRSAHPGTDLPPVIRSTHLAPGYHEVAPAGTLVAVVDADTRKRLGLGMWNPHSSHRLCVVEPCSSEDAGCARHGSELVQVLKARFSAALALRRCILGLPRPGTDAFRLVNREGDGLSGLAVDVLGEALVVRSSALWAELNRDAVLEALQAVQPGAVHWQRDVDSLAMDGYGVFFGHPAIPETCDVESIVVREGGVLYSVTPGTGKKTGHFADQRENRLLFRRFIAAMAAGRANDAGPLRVLDLCCYSGGFAINAALSADVGRVDVTAIDITGGAVAAAVENASLNKVSDRLRVLEANAFVFLRAEAESRHTYDVVFCDPPRPVLTGSTPDDQLRDCVSYHRRIIKRCLQVVAPGGLFVICTCSQVLVRSRQLLHTVKQAAAQEEVSLRLLQRTSSAADHTLHCSWSSAGHLEVLWFARQQGDS